MTHQPEEGDNPSATPETPPHPDAGTPEPETAWEAEATRRYGPPAVRARKNRRYVARLIRRHSEPTLRGILKALSTLDEPMCCERLREHDLDSAPLETIIRPFELLGLHFRVVSESDQRVTVEMGEAYETVGSGGEIQLDRSENHTFRIRGILSQWIA